LEIGIFAYGIERKNSTERTQAKRRRGGTVLWTTETKEKIGTFSPFVYFVSFRRAQHTPFVFKQNGLSFLEQPVGGECAIVLFVAAEFTHQHYDKDNWQSDQSKHEEKSEAHHGICLLSFFSLSSVYMGLVKVS
jgi:hypothetical protein